MAHGKYRKDRVLHTAKSSRQRAAGKAGFAVCHITGSRQTLCRALDLAHDKIKWPNGHLPFTATLPCAMTARHTAKP